MKKIFSLLATTVVITSSCSKPVPEKPRPPQVVVAIAQKKDVPKYLIYPGYMQAYKSVQVQSQVAGLLTGMYFEEGTEVKAGQLLYTIDSRPYRAALDQAEANLAQSIISYKYNEEVVKRYSSLVQDQYVAKLTYDQYVSEMLGQKNAVDSNKAQVEIAKLNLLYTNIYAPMDAVAGYRQVDVGNYITVAESTPMISLNQINPIFASFYVPDTDLPDIQQYQNKGDLKTYIYLNRDPNQEFEGKLTLIDNQVNTGTGSIFMRATLCNEEKKLWPGEFIEVKLILTTLKDSLLIPSQAVQLGSQGAFVYVIDQNNTAQIKPIETALRYDQMIHVTKGIEDTDKVVIEGQLTIWPGAPVAISEKNPVPSSNNNDSVNKTASAKQYMKNLRNEHRRVATTSSGGTR